MVKGYIEKYHLHLKQLKLRKKNSIHTISLIPLSLPEVSFGLEAGLGGGTMVPTERGVVGLAGRGERNNLKKTISM